MINHSTCDHPATSGARAKCRRAHSNGDSTPRKVMGKRERQEKEDDKYGQTPRDRDKECDKCGVEKIEYRGTDMITGILIYVGEKCRWYIKDADDLTALE